MEPFYFKSYGAVKGQAHDLDELKTEMRRLGSEDPACVNWHLSQGHVIQWLNSIGEKSAAEKLVGVTEVSQALSVLSQGNSEHMGHMGPGNRRHAGRPRKRSL
ncbi:MAG: hypothetical protein QXV22_00545 [Thermoplasmataceae archaeon]